MKRYFIQPIIVIAALVFAPILVQSAPYHEQILSFNADITVNIDASLSIVETITVWSSGQIIKRGIVRTFPTRYKDRFNNNVVVDFKLNYVLQDNDPTYYTLKNKANGIIIEIGDDSYIAPGKHTYSIAYTTNRQLGFYKNYDELYWNVTGNGWRLPIAKASAHVHLPPSIPQASIQTDGYTGRSGATDQKYSTRRESDGSIVFSTTTSLEPYEGFTIVTIWQKGFITEPDSATKWRYFFKDNLYLLWALIAFIILILFLMHQWWKNRTHNRQKIVIPLFYPPEGLSAGALYYINTMQFDPIALAAEIVDLAVRGFLTIEYKKSTGFLKRNHHYELIKNEKPINTPTAQEALILNHLFDIENQISINKEKKLMQTVATTFRSRLERYYDRLFIHKKWAKFCCAILILLVLIPLAIIGSSLSKIFFILAGITAFVFSNLFYIYSDEGLTLKAQIDGFKMFLQATESERLKVIGTPPTKSPELYEKYLPYAMALGVEKAWSAQFAPIFEQLKRAGAVYIPIWYRGDKFTSFDSSTFASNLKSSFGSTISASAAAPGSKSGFGGGSSGGGGGGGGGGGR